MGVRLLLGGARGVFLTALRRNSVAPNEKKTSGTRGRMGWNFINNNIGIENYTNVRAKVFAILCANYCTNSWYKLCEKMTSFSLILTTGTRFMKL